MKGSGRQRERYKMEESDKIDLRKGNVREAADPQAGYPYVCCYPREGKTCTPSCTDYSLNTGGSAVTSG